MNPLSILNLLTSISVLLFGIFVYYKSRSGINFIFFKFTFVIFSWLFFYFLAYNANDQRDALFLFKAGYAGIIFIPFFWFEFCTSFLNKRSKLLIILGYCCCFIFLVFLFGSNHFISGLQKYFWGYYPVVSLRIHLFFMLYFNSYFSYSIILLFLEINNKSNFLHSLFISKVKYLFWASLVGTFAAIDFVPNYKVSIYPIGFVFMLFFVAIVSYATIKFRLLDVSLAITKTSIFFIVYSLVLGIPFLSVFFYKSYFQFLLKENWWFIPLITSTILATCGPFLYLFFNKKAEEKILKEQKSYQNVLRNASSGMIRIKDLKQLLNVVVHVVTKTVKIKHAAIYLPDKESNSFVLHALRGAIHIDNFFDVGSPLIWQLNSRKKPIVTEEEILRLRDEPQNHSLAKLIEQLLKMKTALVVPSFVEDRLIGIIMLGEKASGKLYSQDDITVFSVLANQAALAIENAQFYDEVKRTNEQLFQAEKMAMIGTMADGLSHQINNRFHALSLISGDALDILKTHDASSCNTETQQVLSDLRGALERIEANVLQGGEVVKGLLKYSRPGDGGLEMIDFRDVLKGALDMVQYKIKLKEIDLIQDIPSDLPKLHANLVQLQEVFFNLIDNAYDATKERQAALKEDGYRSRIEIVAGSVNGSVEIKVSDNGIGVKDLDKKKLFTPFFTTKATAKKGTGLGLYVIDKIIAVHNGKIEIDSVYKIGTCFTITLPLSKTA